MTLDIGSINKTITLHVHRYVIWRILACSGLSDGWEDAKGKGTRKVGGAGKRKKEGRESL